MCHSSPFTAEEERRIAGVQQDWIAARATGMALHLGCGMKPIQGAINTDPNPDRWAWADLACDAHALPFADGSLDSVVSNHVLPHLRNPIRALAEMARVLRPGGVTAHVIPDLRYAPRRIEPMYPFAHQPHSWRGPLPFKCRTLAAVGYLFSVVTLANFEDFRWSFRFEATKL